MGKHAYESWADGDDFDEDPVEEIVDAQGRILTVGLYPTSAYSYSLFKVGDTFYRRNGVNGEVDDSNVSGGALLNAAINALTTAGHIYLHDATYTTGASIDPAGKNVRITGASKTGTIIEMTAPNLPVLHAKGSIIVETLTLKGSGRGNTNDGIYMDAHEANGCTFSDFSNILITDCEDAIHCVGDIWKVFFYNISSLRVQKFCNATAGAGVNGLNAIFDDVWVDYTGTPAENANYGFDIWSGNALMVYRTQVLAPILDGFRMLANKGISLLDGLQVDYAGRHAIVLDGTGAIPGPGWMHIQVANSTFSVREHDATGGTVPRYAIYLNDISRVQFVNVRAKGCGGDGAAAMGEAVRILNSTIVQFDNLSVETHCFLTGAPTLFNDAILIDTSDEVIMNDVAIWSLTAALTSVGIRINDCVPKFGHIVVSADFSADMAFVGTGDYQGWRSDGSFFSEYWNNTDFRLYAINKRALVYDQPNNWLYVGYFTGVTDDFAKIILRADLVEVKTDLAVGDDITAGGYLSATDYINTNDVYKVDGTQVLTNRQGAIANAGTVAAGGGDSDDVARQGVNANAGKINAVLAVLRTMGIIGP